jgi:hypothetical protein
MGTVSQPVDGHSPATEQKLGKVPQEEKIRVVYVFLAVAVNITIKCGGVSLFSVKGWRGVTIFQPWRKKTLGIRAILFTLGVKKAQKSLKRAL